MAVAVAPAAAAAAPAAASAAGGIGESIATGLGAMALGQHLKDKYGHKVGKMANTFFSAKGRKSAKHGLQRAIKHPMRTTRHVSKYISSGKLLKSVSGLADDAHAVAGMAGQVTGRDMSDVHQAIESGKGQATHYHQIAEGYNEQAKDLHAQGQDIVRGHRAELAKGTHRP
jgi:hypothetical protein